MKSAYIKDTKQRNNKLGIIIVTYGDEKNIEALLLSIIQDKRSGDKIVLIDNHPNQICAGIAEAIKDVDIVIRSQNIGFAAGCNLGASKVLKKVDLLLFLNPDILPEEKAISTLRDKAPSNLSAWMGLITLPNGKVNSAGNIVHLSGLSWCDDYGKSTSSLSSKTKIDILSGACLMIRKEAWEKVGGFPEDYFMYYEDTDISMNLHRQGFKVGIVPSASFVHNYVFNKSKNKWYYLERNRYIFICRQWPTKVILIMLPLLLTTELGLWIISIKQHRFLLRIKSVTSFLMIMPTALRERKTITNIGKITNSQFIQYLHPRMNNPFLGKIGKSKALSQFFNSYYYLAKRLVN